MFIPPIFELSLVGVAEPNHPNRERIVIRPTQIVELTNFAVIVGWRNDAGALIPLWDQFYWFGSITVAPPSWICLYSGKGTYSQDTAQNSGETVYNFYWNRDMTIFPSERVVPMLIRIGGLVEGQLIGPPHPKILPPVK
jgi:hypothetical protein